MFLFNLGAGVQGSERNPRPFLAQRVQLTEVNKSIVYSSIIILLTRALDPHFADPDPAAFLNADPDPAACLMRILIQQKKPLRRVFCSLKNFPKGLTMQLVQITTKFIRKFNYYRFP